jgi:hypothetical protein
VYELLDRWSLVSAPNPGLSTRRAHSVEMIASWPHEGKTPLADLASYFSHAPSFRRALALLFSILSGAILASPEADSVSWGFSIEDKLNSSRTWGNAIISCLQLGDYASSHHIYSVQAILEMHTSAHLVGSTKEWAVYQAAAIVIARGLGLHK